MIFIRAIEGQRTGAIKKSIDAYPLLATPINNPYSSQILQRDGLRPIRVHAITLARERAIRQLHSLQQDAHSLTPAEAQTRRSHIMQTLRRIAPGKATSLQAIKLLTEQSLPILNLWLTHSAPTGHKCFANDGYINTYFTNGFRKAFLRICPRSFRLSQTPAGKSLGKTSLKQSNAHRTLHLARTAFHSKHGAHWVTLQLLYSTMLTTLFPQKVESILRAATTPTLTTVTWCFYRNLSLALILNGDFCTPEDTRLLNITNSDNRLLANAVRLRMEPIPERWISPMQRGFVSGRSVLSNVIDVEEAMMHTALTEEEGAALFIALRRLFPASCMNLLSVFSNIFVFLSLL